MIKTYFAEWAKKRAEEREFQIRFRAEGAYLRQIKPGCYVEWNDLPEWEREFYLSSARSEVGRGVGWLDGFTGSHAAGAAAAALGLFFGVVFVVAIAIALTFRS